MENLIWIASILGVWGMVGAGAVMLWECEMYVKNITVTPAYKRKCMKWMYIFAPLSLVLGLYNLMAAVILYSRK